MMEAKVSASPRRPTGFLDLPTEIRLQIYRYCLVSEDPIRLYVFEFKRSIPCYKNSLLLVSKKVGLEALDVLYGDNIFQLSFDGWEEYDFNENFTEANRRKIRAL